MNGSSQQVVQDSGASGPGASNVPPYGIVAIGLYLALFTLGIVVFLWRLFPSCEPSGMIATRLSPSQVLTSGGEQLRIFGEGFESDVTVRIGDMPPLPAAVVSPFEIVVTTPKRAAGRVSVTVAQGELRPVDIPGGLTYVDSLPSAPARGNASPTQPSTPLQISAVEPSSVGISGGDAVTITGAGFTPDVQVRFGGLPARAVQVDGSRFITAVTPMHPAGSISVVVANEQSISSLDGRLTFVCPTPPENHMVLMILFAGALGGLVHALRSFYWYVGERKLVWSWVAMYALLPFAAAALGFVFYLLVRAGLYQPSGGTSFLLVGLATLVGMFSAQATEKLKDIAEGLFTKAPRGANHAQPATATPASVVAPMISAIKPASGPTAGGATVTITGTGFAERATVRFGSTASAKATFVEASTIKAVVPAATKAGVVDVGVAVPNKAEAVKQGGFTYADPKGKITALSPTEGPVSGGTRVKLTGEQFAKGVAVMFGERPATAVTVIDATSLEAVTPPQTPGAVDVRVDAGTDLIGLMTGAFTYKS